MHPDLGASLNPEDLTAALTRVRDLPMSMIEWYDHEVLRYPLVTKAATSGVCYAIGDLCAQGFQSKDISTVDLGRAARSGAAGFIGHGPIRHYWLDFLDTSLTFGGAWWALGPKIAMDQGAMAVVENAIYSLLMGAFAFKEPEDILRDVRTSTVPQFQASIRFWPLVDLITFTVIPVELQVLWEDVAEIMWICILQEVTPKQPSNLIEESSVMPQPIPVPVRVSKAADGSRRPG
jgi:protein Mpv17